jgi:hypothetical protein
VLENETKRRGGVSVGARKKESPDSRVGGSSEREIERREGESRRIAAGTSGSAVHLHNCNFVLSLLQAIYNIVPDKCEYVGQ